MSKKKRIKKTVETILKYGMIDGAHHKQWILDEALRTLLGDKYYKKIEEYNKDKSSEDWDIGVAP